MKLPSIQQVVRESAATLRRFPLVLTDAAVATLAALIIVDYEGPSTSSILFKVLFASILGFPLLLASALLAERRAWPKSTGFGIQAACVLLLIGYAISVPSNIVAGPFLHVIRLLMLALAMCLLVAIAPFIRRRLLNGFWHYCKTLIQRILLTGVFSGTLYAGLAIAMASVEQLFGVDIPDRRYGELGLFILGIFATWFFLADVPRDMDELDTRTDYPKVLRVFGQYILSPMLIVYFVILYAYVAKIIIEWSWPKGVVSGMIFGFASIGIVAYLLLYPIREKREFAWVRIAARWFWIVMIPMIVVLHLAIWRRVSEYGITENRYIALGLGIWLTAMAVYFLVSKTKSITVIPASICVLSIVASFGPWGIFSVSERSQVGRLEDLLVNNQLLIDGKAQKAREQIPTDDAVQVSAIVRYLHEAHGYGAIQSWFSDNLKQDSAGLGPIDRGPADVVGLLGIEYSRSADLNGRDYGQLTADSARAIDIEGYAHMLVAERLNAETPAFGGPGNGAIGDIDSNLDVMTLRIVENGTVVDSAQVSLRPLVDSLLADRSRVGANNLPTGTMSVLAATQTMKLKVVLRGIQYRRLNDELTPIAYDAVILY